MFNSYCKILGSISISAMFLSTGIASAADIPSTDSIDSRTAQEFVQEQDQTRYRHEEQLRGQNNGTSDAGSREQARRQVRSTEQKHRKAQPRSQQQPQLSGPGRRGMAMGGGAKGGGRR